MKDLLRKAGWSNILIEVIFAILGIAIISQPDAAMKIIATLLGIVFIVAGAIKIIEYFSSKARNEFINYDLIYGIVAVVIGLITITYSSALEFIFRITLGIWIIYSGALRLSFGAKLRIVNPTMGIYSLLIAVVIIISGIIIAFTQNAAIVAVGVITLIYAILDLIESIIFLKNVDKLM